MKRFLNNFNLFFLVLGLFVFLNASFVLAASSCTKVDYCEASTKLSKDEALGILKDLGKNITSKIGDLASLQVLGSTFGGFSNSAKIDAVKEQGRLEGKLEDAKDVLAARQKEVKDKNKEKDNKTKKYEAECKDDPFGASCMTLAQEIRNLEKDITALMTDVMSLPTMIDSLTKRIDDLEKYLKAFDKFEPLQNEVSCLQSQIACVAKFTQNQIDNTPEIEEIKPDGPPQNHEPPKPKECPFPSGIVNKVGDRINKDINNIGSDPNGTFSALGRALNAFDKNKDEASVQAINDALDAMNRAQDQGLFQFGPQGLADYKALRAAVNEFKKCLKEKNCPPGQPNGDNRTSGKRVLFFTGKEDESGRSWCGPCQSWKDNNPGWNKVDGLTPIYIPKNFDGSEESRLYQKYGASGVPMFVFLNADGSVNKKGIFDLDSIKSFLNSK